jgi:flagellar biosynthesis protein FliR
MEQSQYIHIGIFLITVPNLIVIGLMLLVFAVAVIVKLPQEHSTQTTTQPAEPQTSPATPVQPPNP